jgi:myo-inositol 2-dehydrogenase/D-chiro-inositol 1-dehydrogenase
MESKAAQEHSRIGVALVGTGRIGTVHFNNIVANLRLQLLYVVDIDVQRAKEYANKVGPDCQFSNSLDAALKDTNVKGVVICAPTGEHRDLVIASVRAGKAVMCEKPISLKIEEIDECYKEAEKYNVPLFCAYQRRSDPSFAKLQQTCREGGIGTLQIVKTTSRDNPPPSIAYLKISAGIFHDCCVHDIDLLRWITQEDPEEIFSVASAFNKDIAAMKDFDTVLITAKFPSGAIGVIDVSREAVYGYDQRIEVHGSAGQVQAMNRQPTSMILSTKNGVTADTNLYSFPQRYVEAYNNEMLHFVDCLTGKTKPMLSHDDCRKISIIATAAEESARTGKPIKMEGRY